MTSTRLAPNQILTSLPLEAAREATWQALTDAGLLRVLIDAQKNIVVASTRTGIGGDGQNVTATFESRTDGTLISLSSQPQLGGTVETGRSKRHAKKLMDGLEALLSQGWHRDPAAVEPIAARSSVPIAAPTGEIGQRPLGTPVYGVAGPWLRGRSVLTYGILGVLCCQIAAPFALYYGIKALREYGPNDPGDKGMVIVGLVLGVLGTALFVLWLGINGYALMSR